MKINILVYIFAGVVIVGGAVFFMTSNSPGKIASEKIKEVQSGQEKTPLGKEAQILSTSMKDLVALGESLKCTFTSDTESSKSSGTVYVADGKVRGDFSVSLPALGNQSFQAYMITDSMDSYVWSALSKDGYKTPIQKEKQQTPNQDGIDYNQTLNYTCLFWAKDMSVFVPPAEIVFKAPVQQPR